MNPRELVSARKDQIVEMAARFGASNVRLFGSVARGTATEVSDVDLLVVMEPGRSLIDRAGLQIAMEQLLGCRVDIATEKGLKPKLRDRILAEAVAV